jgi:hypothetical protein
VVEVVFQSAFRLEMHQNNIFYFLKFIFDISTNKTKTIQKHKNNNLKLKTISKAPLDYNDKQGLTLCILPKSTFTVHTMTI